ncbi:DUF6064 family protein [Falsiroseomonas sp.]|uniref:DUF6064 family protein n=1 Tax=Falsiroseomonas sp. TaxID=2870721 RepID=UPI003563B055
MLPFTVAEFFAVFAAYNAAIWPAQAVALLLGAGTVALALRGGGAAARLVPAALAAMWIWTGLGYHLLHFAAINPAARLFGAAFLLQGGLLLLAAVRRGGLPFGPPRGWRGVFGLALVAYAALVYPLLGRLAGHEWSDLPAFGVTPCPVTIFTFGILLLAEAPVPRWLLAVPLLWAVIGGSAAVLLAVPQDWLLLVGGLAAGAVMLRQRRGHPGAA